MSPPYLDATGSGSVVEGIGFPLRPAGTIRFHARIHVHFQARIRANVHCVTHGAKASGRGSSWLDFGRFVHVWEGRHAGAPGRIGKSGRFLSPHPRRQQTRNHFPDSVSRARASQQCRRLIMSQGLALQV